MPRKVAQSSSCWIESAGKPSYQPSYHKLAVINMLETRPFQPLQTCPGQLDQPCLIQIAVSDNRLVRVEIMHLPLVDLIRLQGILTVVHIITLYRKWKPQA